MDFSDANAMIINPAFDYDNEAHDYASVRRADPRIGQYVADALRDATTVLNVGAGTGSYEPAGKHVVAVEPSSGCGASGSPAARRRRSMPRPTRCPSMTKASTLR